MSQHDSDPEDQIERRVGPIQDVLKDLSMYFTYDPANNITSVDMERLLTDVVMLGKAIHTDFHSIVGFMAAAWAHCYVGHVEEQPSYFGHGSDTKQ